MQVNHQCYMFAALSKNSQSECSVSVKMIIYSFAHFNKSNFTIFITVNLPSEDVVFTAIPCHGKVSSRLSNTVSISCPFIVKVPVIIYHVLVKMMCYVDVHVHMKIYTCTY
jgi:hypothetical protein